MMTDWRFGAVCLIETARVPGQGLMWTRAIYLSSSLRCLFIYTRWSDLFGKPDEPETIQQATWTFVERGQAMN